MSEKIGKRDDVNSTEGQHKYGEVEFADPTNKKYPVDTPEHVRAAWSYMTSNQRMNSRPESTAC